MASVLQVETIKDSGGNANAIEIANNSANVTINNLAGGSIADAVTQPATDYIQGRVQANANIGAYTMLNLSGSTNPYVAWTGSIASFGDGGGSTVTGTTEHDLKFRTKGVYHIFFSCTFVGSDAETTRYAYAVIRGNGSTSEGATELAYAMDQVANTNSGSGDYGNCGVSYVGLFNANDQINFQVYNSAANNDIHSSSHISVLKLKSVA